MHNSCLILYKKITNNYCKCDMFETRLYSASIQKGPGLSEGDALEYVIKYLFSKPVHNYIR